MTPESIAYGGWPNCLRLTNGTIELVVTTDVGPRIIRFGFVGEQNLFQNFAEEVGRTGDAEWLIYGGHRLWHAPEIMPRTYHPDNEPVAWDWNGATLTLSPPEQTANHLQLAMAITLDPDRPLVAVEHRITNTHAWEVELAHWCPSVMAAGGRAVCPQEPYIPHPDRLLPARPLVLWHFTRMADPRWTWGDRYLQLRQDNAIPAKQKVGATNSRGWVAYLLREDVFLKRFGYSPAAAYPDFGSNCELFTMPEFLEVESLGPLTRLAPGETSTHTERWGLFKGTIGETDEEMDRDLLPLVDQVPPV